MGIDVVSHLIMQVHLGPTGEEKLYHISMTPDTGPHVGSHAILRNRMRLNSADKLETDRYTCYKVLTVLDSQNVITPLSVNILPAPSDIVICILLHGKLKEAATEYKSYVHCGSTCDPSCLIWYN